ncbi:MAG: hypothetical protein JWR80_1039 [Bradyrhizobium sp.]|nr:hypothetical protein [Bradyrhizobium sp.]
MKKIEIPFTPEQKTKLADLEAKRARVTAEANAIDEERRKMVTDPASLPTPTDPSSVRIAALLGEAPPVIIPEHRTRLVDLAQRSRDLRQACDLLAQQIRQERHKAAVEARLKLAPEYRTRIRAICEAFKAVHAANVELHALTGAMEDAGIEWGALGYVGPKQLGSPRNPYSPVAQYFKDAADLGFITRNEIPEALRQ